MEDKTVYRINVDLYDIPASLARDTQERIAKLLEVNVASDGNIYHLAASSNITLETIHESED